MDMHPDIRAMLEGIVATARINLEMSGRLLPVAFIFGKNKTVHIVGCPWENAEDKDGMVAGLKKFCREKEAVGIAILGEAWTAVLKKGEWDGTPADKQPGKKEVVLINVETLDGYWMGTSDIIRTSGKPTFGEMKFEPVTQEIPVAARFGKFLA